MRQQCTYVLSYCRYCTAQATALAGRRSAISKWKTAIDFIFLTYYGDIIVLHIIIIIISIALELMSIKKPGSMVGRLIGLIDKIN